MIASLRLKVFIISVLIGAFLLIFFSVLIWSSARNIQEVRNSRLEINELETLAKLHLDINRQLRSGITYIISGNDEALREFRMLSAIITDDLRNWYEAARIRQRGKAVLEGLEVMKYTEGLYENFYYLMQKAIELASKGKSEDALQLLNEKIQPLAIDMLLVKIEALFNFNIVRINDSYENMLLSMSSMLFYVKEGLRQAKVARASTEAFISVNRVALNIDLQMTDLAFFACGNLTVENRFNKKEPILKEAFREWESAEKFYLALKNESLSDSLSRLEEIERQYYKFLTLAQEAWAWKEPDEHPQAVRLILQKINPLIERNLVPTLVNAIELDKVQNSTAHTQLLQATISTGVQGVSVLVAVLLLSAFGFIHLLSGIVVSLQKLAQGTEIIGKGNLAYRIQVKSKDELGQLAASFNRMAADIQKAQEKITSDKAYIENIVGCMKDALLVISTSGFIQTVNPATCVMLGYSEQEIIGQPAEKIFADPEVLKAVWASVRLKKEENVGAKIKCSNIETNFLAKDERQIPVLFSFSVMYDTGGLARGTVCIALDITERKQAEEKLKSAYDELKATQVQLVQAEKMASLGRMVAGIAHELNNPLSYILTNISALSDYVLALTKIAGMYQQQNAFLREGGIKEAETVNQALEELKKKVDYNFLIEDISRLAAETLEGTQKIKGIIQDLKIFSRSERADKVSTDINACLESSLRMLWNEIKYKADVVKEFSELPQVLCYPQQLSQIFLNLIGNSIDAISTNGTISLKTYEKDKNIFIEISDTGSGIAPEHLPHIFEPFFTTKDPGKGTGLGLSIVHEIVKKHNGEISVKSKVGEGTTFVIRLPILTH